MNDGWSPGQKPDAALSKGEFSTFFSLPCVCTSACSKIFLWKKQRKILHLLYCINNVILAKLDLFPSTKMEGITTTYLCNEAEIK